MAWVSEEGKARFDEAGAQSLIWNQQSLELTTVGEELLPKIGERTRVRKRKEPAGASTSVQSVV